MSEDTHHKLNLRQCRTFGERDWMTWDEAEHERFRRGEETGGEVAIEAGERLGSKAVKGGLGNVEAMLANERRWAVSRWRKFNDNLDGRIRTRNSDLE